MCQSLLQVVKTPVTLVDLLHTKVCHFELIKTDAGVAGVADHDPRLRAQDDQECSDVELASHIESRLHQVPLYDNFVEVGDLHRG